MTKKANRNTKSYISDHYPCLVEQLNYVNKLVEGFNEDTQHLFKHLIVSTLVNAKRSCWIPIPGVSLWANLRGAKWKDLEDRGLIETTGYSSERKICRKFKVNTDIINTFVLLDYVEIEQRHLVDKYNLFDGKVVKNKFECSKRYDENKHKYSDVILRALGQLSTGYFNRTAAIAYLRKEYKLWLDAKQQFGETDYQTIKLRGRFINDRNGLVSTLDQDAQKVEDNIWSYKLAYNLTSTGRISQVRGGLQTCTRKMKAAAYMGIENLKNYDLKSSQINGLIQQLEIARINTSVFVEYRDNKNAKHEYAERIGISVECWKNCLCAMMFSATISKPNPKLKKKVEQYKAQKWVQEDKNTTLAKKYKLSAINKYLYEEAKEDIDLYFSYLSKFNDAVGEMKKAIDQWHEFLVKTYIPKVKTRYRDGNEYIKNDAGLSLCITDLQNAKSDWLLKSRTASFILQGVESAYIHRLTALSATYGYKVIANEHDGLVTIGTIPQEACDEAAKLSGLKYAFLEEKPLEGQDAIAELKSYEENFVLEIDEDYWSESNFLEMIF